MILIYLASAAEPMFSLGGGVSEPTTLTCQFARADGNRKFAGTDRLAVYLPEGLVTKKPATIEVRDPSGLMRGGSFAASERRSLQNIFFMHGTQWPHMLLTMKLGFEPGTNTILGPIGGDVSAPKDSDRNGICRVTTGQQARKSFETWTQVSAPMERGL